MIFNTLSKTRTASLGMMLLLALLIPTVAQALTVTPNDPHFDTQYYIGMTQVDQAWGYSVGSPDVVIAVIDSGVDLDHPDLKDNIWINQDEIADNGRDDDNNGYIDDVYGWNFVDNNNDPNPQFKNYSTEGVSHGTLVAGVIAGSGNNGLGIAGISWRSKIMALRALNSIGEGYTGDAAQAIRYAVKEGADIINLSFVGRSNTTELQEAIKYAYQQGIVIVAAVGNDALGTLSTSDGGDLDTVPVYPACYRDTQDDWVIGVGAVDKNKSKADFSNFGLTCLDINAPGVDMVSTQTMNPKLGEPFNAAYSGLWNGTSFAAPQVSGLAALIKSFNGNYSNKQIAAIIADTADSLDAQNPDLALKMGAGLINSRRALKAAAPANFAPQDPIELLKLAGDSAALWFSDKIDTQAYPNNFLSVKISFKNKGIISWESTYLKIKITDRQGNPLGFNPAEIDYHEISTVEPSQIANFSDVIHAPSHSGLYDVKFILTYKNQPIKGGALYKTIEVKPVHLAVLTETKLPVAVLSKWRQITASIKIKNNSAGSWQKKNLALKLETTDPCLKIAGAIRPQEDQIKNGATATFAPTLIFKNCGLGLKRYTLKLQTATGTIGIESGERFLRID